MKFAVVRLRAQGVVLDARRLAAVAPVVGDLRVEHAQDEELRRPVRLARLFRPDRTVDAELLPPLLDVQLIGMATQGFTLAGVERDNGRCFAQSWWVREP